MGWIQKQILLLSVFLITQLAYAGDVTDEATLMMRSAAEKLRTLGKPSALTVEVEISGVLRGPHDSGVHLSDDTNSHEETSSTEAGVQMTGQGQH